MPGVALNETIDCNNPLLQFFFQTNGLLTDVEELSFVTFDASGTQIEASGTLDLTDCPVGVRLSPGRYAAILTATAGTYTIGTHRITWTYKVLAADPSTKKWSQTFEVLDDALFGTGAGFRTYAPTASLQENNAFAGCSVGSLQEVGVEIAEQIERLTGRYFEPRFVEMQLNATDAGALPIQEPIIGISRVEIIGGDTASGLLSIEVANLRIYNRHLQGPSGSIGMIDHDDRDNPRIEFSTDLPPGVSTSIGSRFQRGRMNTVVAGVFGYTEPDGTPVGRTPRRLNRVAGILMWRRIMDPYGMDASISQPGRIREAKTRDQMIKFGGATDGSIGPLTGDRIVDDTLISYMRPPHYGAVGNTARDGAEKGSLRSNEAWHGRSTPGYYSGNS